MASYGDVDAAVAALRGIELLFMVSASESVDRVAQHRAFIDAAAKAGVVHVVYTSFLGAAADATFTLALRCPGLAGRRDSVESLTGRTPLALRELLAGGP